MNATATATPTPRVVVKHFGRTFDNDKGVVTIDVMGKPEANTSADFTKLPEAMKIGFGLKAYTDYITNAGNAAVRGTPEKPGSLDDGVAALKEAIEDAEAGEVEFSEGLGLGMSSSPMSRLLGRALVEEGYKFVSNKGTRYEFEGDVAKAIAAMKALYTDTVAPKVDDGKGGTRDGDTGRQIFRKIAAQPKIAARIESYRKEKPAAALGGDLLG